MAPEYQRETITPSELSNRILRDISGLINHSHFDLIMKEDLPACLTFIPYPSHIKTLLDGDQWLQRINLCLQYHSESFLEL